MAHKTRSIEVVELGTGKIVHRMNVDGKSPSQLDRVEMGILRQMDLDRYSIRRSAHAAAPRKGE